MFKIIVSSNLVKNKINLPAKGTKRAAGIDIYTMSDIFIPVGETAMIEHGIKLINTYVKNEYAMTVSRSSSNLNGIVVHNGVIDGDYTGDLKTVVTNLSNRQHKRINEKTMVIEEGIKIEKNTRISQIIFINVQENNVKIYFEDNKNKVEEVKVIKKENRDQRGFGSTGKH